MSNVIHEFFPFKNFSKTHTKRHAPDLEGRCVSRSADISKGENPGGGCNKQRPRELGVKAQERGACREGDTAGHSWRRSQIIHLQIP
jgi:hypothetical protein